MPNVKLSGLHERLQAQRIDSARQAVVIQQDQAHDQPSARNNDIIDSCIVSA